jgi:SAM-dependent methyltransferase
MSTRIDYDRIAHLYDDSRRDHPLDPRLVAFAAASARPEAVCALDVGCGTGKQLAADRVEFARMRLVGVDVSARMLRLAKARAPNVTWVRGDAQALPLVSSAFDYVTNQFSYPHIPDKRRFVREVFRVMRSGGRFVLTNIDPWAMSGWLIYRYFAGTRALDERDFLPPASLASLLDDAGFANVSVESTDLSQDQDLGKFLASVSQRHSASQLMAIPDSDYEAGLDAVREAVARAGPAGASVSSQFVIITITADKP